MVRLARAEYEEPDSAIIRQALSQQTQMQEFLLTTGPFVPASSRKRPIAVVSHQSLNYRISEEKSKGTDDIAKSNNHLFSTFYSITKLQSGDISYK